MTLEKSHQSEDALFDFSGGSYTLQRETYMHTRSEMVLMLMSVSAGWVEGVFGVPRAGVRVGRNEPAMLRPACVRNVARRVRVGRTFPEMSQVTEQAVTSCPKLANQPLGVTSALQ
jgi:hypothetical protein